MDWTNQIDWSQLLTILGIMMLISLILAGLLLVWIVITIRRIHLPEDADPITALRMTPFSVVLMLDLLDFGLDFFAAPFAWAILTYLGLKPLRGVTVVESLIPGTQGIPTWTIAWILARLGR